MRQRREEDAATHMYVAPDWGDKGVSATLLHERVKAVEVVEPQRVRFVLHSPWPDFLTFYGSLATGASWIVPKKYLHGLKPKVW